MSTLATHTTLHEPRFENGRCCSSPASAPRYDGPKQSAQGHSRSMQRFRTVLGQRAGQVGKTAYGVCLQHGRPPGTWTTCGVANVSTLCAPPDFTRLRIPAHRYAVFSTANTSPDPRNVARSLESMAPCVRPRGSGCPFFELYSENFNFHLGERRRGTVGTADEVTTFDHRLGRYPCFRSPQP